jgi:hypothetical protein
MGGHLVFKAVLLAAVFGFFNRLIYKTEPYRFLSFDYHKTWVRMS